MKREIEIIAYSAERTGVSKKDGQQWYNRDIVVQWFEEGPNGRYEQQTVVSINKRLNPLLLEQAVKNREKIAMSFYFGYREYDGTGGKAYFAQTKGYLPEAYELKDIK
jgi:hypothetical protein